MKIKKNYTNGLSTHQGSETPKNTTPRKRNTASETPNAKRKGTREEDDEPTPSKKAKIKAEVSDDDTICCKFRLRMRNLASH